MDESGISLGYDLEDLNAIISDEFLKNITATDMEPVNYYEIRSKPAPLYKNPSFKTEVVKSRTQFKQQLMRDQLQKERERRNAEDEKELVISAPAPATKVSFNLQNVALPQNVLQVTTGLKNPTKYHIMEKKKNQVLQYLSSSQQEITYTGENEVVYRDHTDRMHGGPTTPKSSKSFTVLQPALSPSVMSVTSGGTSDAEDVLEGLLSYEETEVDPQSLYGSNASLEKLRDTNSCPSGMPPCKQEPYTGSVDNNRDRVKKDTHNMIERRRRYNINDRIKELGDLLPQRHEPHYDVVRDSRSNKGTILKSSVDYIKMLKCDVNKMKQMEEDNRQLQAVNRKLLLRIQRLEIEARSKGVTLQEETWKIKRPAEIDQYIKPVPRPRSDMPDLVSETSFVRYDESMEDIALPDPMLAAATVLPRVQHSDVDMD